MTRYLKNCFLLLLPILGWNLLLTSSLPEGFSRDIFWNEISSFVGLPENILRGLIMVLPAFMILSLKTKTQRLGGWLYLLGVVVYGLSWLLLILTPDSSWSQSMMGFMAPAYTTILWLVGIGLIGEQSFFKIKHVSTIYILLATVFVFFHTWHTYIVFHRL